MDPPGTTEVKRSEKEAMKVTKLIGIGTGLLVVLLTLAVPANGLLPTVFLLIVGKVELRRSGWPKFQLISAPRMLAANDWVRSSQDSGRILCSDIRLRPIPKEGALVQSVCPQSAPPKIKYRSSQVGPTRGGTNPLLPFLISPRRTAILEEKPLFRWNAVPNATWYTVHLRGPTGVIWQAETHQTEIRYPDQPPLQPGIGYALIIQSSTGTSSTDEGIPGLGFRLLDRTQAQTIQAMTTEIAQQEMNEEAKAIALAHLYNGEELTSNAIQTLEVALAKGKRTPAIYQLLGDLYLQVRLNQLARDQYLQALNLVSKSSDPDVLANLQIKLSGVYLQLKQRQAAMVALKAARMNYMLLEGKQGERVKTIDKQLAELGL